MEDFKVENHIDMVTSTGRGIALAGLYIAMGLILAALIRALGR